jgi:hypothetical protein
VARCGHRLGGRARRGRAPAPLRKLPRVRERILYAAGSPPALPPRTDAHDLRKPGNSRICRCFPRPARTFLNHVRWFDSGRGHPAVHAESALVQGFHLSSSNAADPLKTARDRLTEATTDARLTRMFPSQRSGRHASAEATASTGLDTPRSQPRTSIACSAWSSNSVGRRRRRGARAARRRGAASRSSGRAGG